MKFSNLLFILALLVYQSAYAAGSDKETQASMKVHKYPIRKIKRITIKNPQATSFSKEADCSGLRIDSHRIRFFLRNAQPNSEYSFGRALQVGDCSAEGTVTFENGRTVVVSLTSSIGRGAIRAGKMTYFMDCAACEDILEPAFKFDPKAKSPTHQ